MNQVNISGRLVRDVEIQTIKTGTKYVKNALAVKKDYGDGAEFIPLIFWRQHAEYIKNYGSKGSHLIITGKLHINTYEREINGQMEKRTSTEVNVTNVEIVQHKVVKQLDTSKEAALQRQQKALNESNQETEVPWQLDL